MYVTGFRCGAVRAVSIDGAINQTVLSWKEANPVGGCHGFGAAYNKDGTMLAYSVGNSGVPTSEGFNPVNAGLYLSLTELCKTQKCMVPKTSIPILEGEQQLGSIQIATRYDHGNPSYTAFMKAGYEQYISGILDEKEKRLTILVKTPRAGAENERDVTLYLSSKLIDGNIAIFINGTQFYPTLVEDNENCLAVWSKEYCAEITANVDKIEGGSIISIKDNTTNPRTAVNIEIIGTTAIPEFGSLVSIVMTVAALTGFTLPVIMRRHWAEIIGRI